MHTFSWVATSGGYCWGGLSCFSEHRLQKMWPQWALQLRLSDCGACLVAPQHVKSPDQDQTHVPCFGRWILIPCTIREVLLLFLCKLSQSPIYSLSDLILFLETRPGKPSWEQLSIILTPIMSCPYTSVFTHQCGHLVICRCDFNSPLWGYKLLKDRVYFIPILYPLQ